MKHIEGKKGRLTKAKRSLSFRAMRANIALHRIVALLRFGRS
jgi:hypothetical protein